MNENENMTTENLWDSVKTVLSVITHLEPDILECAVKWA